MQFFGKNCLSITRKCRSVNSITKWSRFFLYEDIAEENFSAFLSLYDPQMTDISTGFYGFYGFYWGSKGVLNFSESWKMPSCAREKVLNKPLSQKILTDGITSVCRYTWNIGHTNISYWARGEEDSPLWYWQNTINFRRCNIFTEYKVNVKLKKKRRTKAYRKEPESTIENQGLVHSAHFLQ